MNLMVLTINSRDPKQHFEFCFFLCLWPPLTPEEAFFGDLLWEEAAVKMCDIDITVQIYDAMLSFYVQEKCWICTQLLSSFDWND